MIFFQVVRKLFLLLMDDMFVSKFEEYCEVESFSALSSRMVQRSDDSFKSFANDLNARVDFFQNVAGRSHCLLFVRERRFEFFMFYESLVNGAGLFLHFVCKGFRDPKNFLTRLRMVHRSNDSL